MKNKYIKRKGLPIILAILFVILINILCIHYSAKDYTFSDFETKNTEINSFLDKKSVNNDPVKIILYKPNCPYCKNVEHLIVKEIRQHKTQKFLVIDVSKLNKKQISELVRRVPELASNNHLYVPTVAQIESNHNKWQVLRKVVGDDKVEIKKILDSKENHFLTKQKGDRK